jgi:hypothetical protein
VAQAGVLAPAYGYAAAPIVAHAPVAYAAPVAKVYAAPIAKIAAPASEDFDAHPQYRWALSLNLSSASAGI